jgi:hypothetical protein
MATPPRLVELKCPMCHAHHWEIDNDYRGAELVGAKELSYAERTYRCPACGTSGTGYQVGRKSPPEFFLQPHPMYRMTVEEFDHWVAVLREHFPDHPRLGDVGTSWYASGRQGTRFRNVTALYSWFRRKLDL